MNPYVAIIFGCLLASSAGIFIKRLDLPLVTIASLRFFVPLVISFLIIKYKKIKLFVGPYKTMLFASFLNAVRLFFYFGGFLYTTLTNSVVILYTWPIFAALFGVIVLKEKVTLRHAALFGLAFFGLVVMNLNKEFSVTNSDFIGMGSMLISAIILGLTNVTYKKAISLYSNYETIFYQNLIGSIIFTPIVFFLKPYPTFYQLSFGSLYGLIIGIIAFYLFFSAMRSLQMSQYSLFKYFEVVFTVIVGILVFGDVLTTEIIIGGFFILAAGYFLKK